MCVCVYSAHLYVADRVPDVRASGSVVPFYTVFSFWVFIVVLLGDFRLNGIFNACSTVVLKS